MMSAKEVYMEMLKLSLMMSLGEDELRQKIAEKYIEYVNSLPERAKKRTMVVMTEKGCIVVSHEEIPKKILEDDEFYRWFLEMLRRRARRRYARG